MDQLLQKIVPKVNLDDMLTQLPSQNDSSIPKIIQLFWLIKMLLTYICTFCKF